MKRKLLAAISLLIFVSLVSSVSARSFYVEPRCYFRSESSNYINFESDQILSTLYQESGVWYFGDYNFQVSSANMTINNFFLNNILEFTVTRDAGSSVSTIYVDELGEPSSVVGSSSWSYDDETAILLINVDHASAQVVDVYWDILSPDIPSRGEFIAAGVILALIVVPLLILIIFAARRRR